MHLSSFPMPVVAQIIVTHKRKMRNERKHHYLMAMSCHPINFTSLDEDVERFQLSDDICLSTWAKAVPTCKTSESETDPAK